MLFLRVPLPLPQERMSLKHQNKGKWARSRAIMAKYDLEVSWGLGKRGERLRWGKGSGRIASGLC